MADFAAADYSDSASTTPFDGRPRVRQIMLTRLVKLVFTATTLEATLKHSGSHVRTAGRKFGIYAGSQCAMLGSMYVPMAGRRRQAVRFKFCQVLQTTPTPSSPRVTPASQMRLHPTSPRATSTSPPWVYTISRHGKLRQ